VEIEDVAHGPIEVFGRDEKKRRNGHAQKNAKFPFILPAGVVARSGGVMLRISRFQKNHRRRPIRPFQDEQDAKNRRAIPVHADNLARLVKACRKINGS